MYACSKLIYIIKVKCMRVSGEKETLLDGYMYVPSGEIMYNVSTITTTQSLRSDGEQ